MKFRVLLLLLCLLVVPASMAFAQGGSDRSTITADNVRNLELLRRIGRGNTSSVTWSPDGQYILVGSTVGVWKYEATALDTTSEPELITTRGEVVDFAVSPDGQTLAVGAGTSSAFYDVASGDMIAAFESDFNSPSRLAYSADGQYVAANQSSKLTVFDVGQSAIYTSVPSLSLNTAVPVLISPDNTKLFAVNRSNAILVWDFVDGGEPAQWTGHTSTVSGMTFSPDGSLLITGAEDNNVIVWNVETGEQVQTITQPTDDSNNQRVRAIAISPDGSSLLTGHNSKIRIWDVASASVRSEIAVTSSVKSLAYSPDGSQFVALVLSQAIAVQLFSSTGDAVATSFYHNTYIGGTAFSPDSAQLSFNDGDRFLYIWDTQSAPEITETIKLEDAVGTDTMINSIIYTSDNRYMATLRAFDATIRDAATGELIHELDPIVDGLGMDIAFSPDDTLLAFGSSRGLYVIDVESGQLLFFTDEANDWIQSVVWSPDQTLLAVAGDDDVVRVYAIVE